MTSTSEFAPLDRKLVRISGHAGELTAADQHEAAAALAEMVARGMAPNTRRAYRSDVRYFTRWYQAHYGREFPGFPLICQWTPTFTTLMDTQFYDPVPRFLASALSYLSFVVGAVVGVGNGGGGLGAVFQRLWERWEGAQQLSTVSTPWHPP